MKALQLTTLFLVVVAAVVFAAEDQPSGQRVEVTAKVGPIVGETITAEHRPVARFLGVPYGKVPRRFRRSMPVERWTSPHEALHWPANCWQNPDHPFNAFTRSLVLTEQLAEDCLHLNIWTPVDSLKEKEEEGHLRPLLSGFTAVHCCSAQVLCAGMRAKRWPLGLMQS